MDFTLYKIKLLWCLPNLARLICTHIGWHCPHSRCNKLLWLAPLVFSHETTAALRMEGGNSLYITCPSGVPRTLRLPALSVDFRRTLAVACWDGVAAVSLVQVGIDFRIGEFSLSCASEKWLSRIYFRSIIFMFTSIFPSLNNLRQTVTLLWTESSSTWQ